MSSRQNRARRIAVIRRQLARLPGGRQPAMKGAVAMESLECGGRGHLISAASGLIAGYLRALSGGRSAAPTRSDYLLDLMRGPAGGGAR